MRSHLSAARTWSRALTAGSVAALLTVAGCTDSSGSDDEKASVAAAAGAAAAAGPPVIDEAAAKALMRRITAATNKANAAQSADQVAGYEAEASLTSDAAALRAYLGRPIGALNYAVEKVLAPAADAGADFFVADTQIGSATEHYPMVLARAAGKDWRVVHSAPLTAPLPALKRGAAGSVEVVPAEDPGQTLIAAPAKIAQAHAESLSAPAQSGPFAGDTVSAKVVEADEARATIVFENSQPPESFTVAAAVAPYPARALRTADGGALVAYTTRTDYTATRAGAEPELGPVLSKLGEQAPAGGRKTPAGGAETPAGKVTVSVLNMWWTQVPARGKGDKVTVLGGTNQPVEVK